MTKPADAAAPNRIYGFCWFKRETYDASRAAMSDPENLFDTFDEWLAAARKVEREVTARGAKIVRIRFDLAAFLLWCVSHGRLPDEQARANWAAAEARKRFGTRA